MRDAEVQPLIEEPEEDEGTWRRGHGRQRSGTATSRSTTNSLSSRGDLIMSDEDEYEDAQPLDDSFAVMLSRRNTNQGSTEDQSSGKTRSPGGKRPGVSRNVSTRTVSSKSSKGQSGKSSQRSASSKSLVVPPPNMIEEPPEPPTIADLRREEEDIAQEEELEVQQKREAAQRLALDRGLSSRTVDHSASTEVKPDEDDIGADTVLMIETIPEPVSPVHPPAAEPEVAVLERDKSKGAGDPA